MIGEQWTARSKQCRGGGVDRNVSRAYVYDRVQLKVQDYIVSLHFVVFVGSLGCSAMPPGPRGALTVRHIYIYQRQVEPETEPESESDFEFKLDPNLSVDLNCNFNLNIYPQMPSSYVT